MLAAVLLALAGQAGASPEARDSRLSATLVGRLEPGATGHLALRWDEPEGMLLDAWVDLDGDGVPTPDELIAEGRPLASGIEVVSFDLAAGTQVQPQPRVRVAARAAGSRDAQEAAPAAASAKDRDDCAWQPGFTVADLDGNVYAMSVFDDGSGPALYVGGDFLAANGVIVNNIARWDGSAWSALSGPSGTGTGGSWPGVWSLSVFDDGSGPDLYAGGPFTTAGGVTVNGVARWDGSSWSALSGPSGTGTNGNVAALAVFDDGSGLDLYAGGDFTIAGGVTVNSIARWDGTSWSALGGPLGIGMDDTVWALTVFDDGAGPDLYAGGSFTTAGGLWVYSVARWNATSWSKLDTGTTDDVYALTVFDDGAGPDLYAGGCFGGAGGETVNGIARWDGNDWSALSGPSGTGMDHNVETLAVFDDVSGEALYAGGTFTTAGGVTVDGIARWDGTAWSALSGPSGTGLGGESPYVWALEEFNDGSGPVLYAGGWFKTAGGLYSGYIAAWSCLSPIFADGFEHGNTNAWTQTVP